MNIVKFVRNEKIRMLKERLTATDYKVLKNAEAQMAGDALPYDPVALHAERQPLRDEINRLEGEE